jgi:DNA primase catalytic core
MKSITDFIKYQLYPALFYRVDIAFPEHKFSRFPGGWRSPTYLDGSEHPKNRLDKTIISKRAPGFILEQGGETLSLVDYVMRRDNVDFLAAVKNLSDIAGLQIPEIDIEQDSYIQHKNDLTLLEDCNLYFIFCLEKEDDAGECRRYLNARGYSKQDIKDMELGFIPSQQKMKEYLLHKGYSDAFIENTIRLSPSIGVTHKISIPYRSGGIIKGFKFRAINDSFPKYLNATGLDKKSGFFNMEGIKGEKDLVLVEGEFDALHATVKGMKNVVAIGGNSISREQVIDAIALGAKSFTLCLDNDNDKSVYEKKIQECTENLLQAGVNRIYIATLPDIGGEKNDPDKYIKERGIEAFKSVIQQALPYYEYHLQKIIQPYLESKARGEMYPQVMDTLLERAYQVVSRIPNKIQRIRYQKLLLSGGLQGFARQYEEERVKNENVFLNRLLLPLKEKETVRRLRDSPKSLDSCYFLNQERLFLPAGAISVFAAPTSHGKTTLLINLALNVVQKYPDKSFHFFSYEEDIDSILISALNVYINKELSVNNRAFIRSYFEGNPEKINSHLFEFFVEKKEAFYKELIDTGRLHIHNENCDSATLIDAIRYLKKNGKIGGVFIDYIQLLKLPKGEHKTYSRQEELKEICLSLNAIAVETRLPVIVGAQFNREVNNLLKLHACKIGEAGDIERVANLIVGFWNNHFAPVCTESEANEIGGKDLAKNTLYVMVLKNRYGRVGVEDVLLFNGNTGKIENKKHLDFKF